MIFYLFYITSAGLGDKSGTQSSTQNIHLNLLHLHHMQ